MLGDPPEVKQPILYRINLCTEKVGLDVENDKANAFLTFSDPAIALPFDNNKKSRTSSSSLVPNDQRKDEVATKTYNVR